MTESGADLAALWVEFATRVGRLAELTFAEGAPSSDAERAGGLRYLTRFLGAGLRLCIEHEDADHPVFARMVENGLSWGLDNPDCNYSWARVRGDAQYRIEGRRGGAKQLEFQVNTGHFGDGDIPAFTGGEEGWRCVSHLSGDTLVCADDGAFEIGVGREAEPGNWLRLDDDSGFVLVRQYFDDWEHEEPAVFSIVREDAPFPPASLTPEALQARFDRLFEWLETGARCWNDVSRLLLSMPANTMVMSDVDEATDRPGLHGQTYGMGPFACEPDEALIVEFPVPECRMWSVALANFWWESLDFGSRQTSLNGHWACLDDDGSFRGVIAHTDPGVPNWLDAEDTTRGTLAVRFLMAEQAPVPEVRSVPLASVRDALPPDTPRVSLDERSAVLARRSRALQRRYGY